MNQEKIGKFIKNIRLQNKLTQKEFADSLGVTYQAVSKWENGKNAPDLAIIKEISEKYDVDIKEILDGEVFLTKKNKFNKKYIYFLLIILFIFLLIFLIIFLNKPDNDFEFKKISTTCTNFKITGTVAYSEETSSMYISKLEFCGEEDNTIYDEINCNLYEEASDSINSISACKSASNITLKDYLEDLTINVDKYQHSCKNFANKTFYIEIEALKENNIVVTYKVPLNFENTCD